MPLKVRIGGVVVGAFATLGVLVLFVALITGAWQSGKPGEVGVIRNGAFWNGSGIRGLMPQAASVSWVGISSSVHFYPAGNVQRYYTITSNPSAGDRPGVDIVSVPTADGIQVGIEGTIYFHDAFDGSARGNKLLEDFDTQFGTRTFPVLGKPGAYTHAYAGDVGWSSFLDAVVRPVIDNELRQAIGTSRCAQLVASCALVTNNSHSLAVFGNTDTQANIQQVQQQVNNGLLQNLNTTLGEPYFSDISFRLSRVTLPSQVQNAINAAQSSFAQVTQQQAQVQQAKLIAAANRAKELAYKQCPACATIDEIKALGNLPSGVTVFFGVPTSGVNVNTRK